jgi:REP element-mobilizing transposase RayT
MRRYTYDSVSVWNRHGLPHWNAPRGLYFVTWRLAGSIARVEELELRNLHQELARLRATNAPERSLTLIEREYFRVMERSLDRGEGAAYMNDVRIAELVSSALEYGDGRAYNLITHSVMPNHVHVVFRLLEDLDAVIQRWKSFTAHEANRILDRQGPFWSDDYFDVLIRNSLQLERTVAYVRNNPLKAELFEWRWIAFRPEIYSELL